MTQDPKQCSLVPSSWMAVSLAILCCIIFTACSSTTGEWKTADEGFTFSMPGDWRKREYVGIDSHVGKYSGRNMVLEFDHIDGVMYPQKEARAAIADLKRKQKDGKLLIPGEEIWVQDGRLASFEPGVADPERYGMRKYGHVARLFVPFEDEPGYLKVLIFYKEEGDLPTVLRVMRSFRWKFNEP